MIGALLARALPWHYRLAAVGLLAVAVYILGRTHQAQEDQTDRDEQDRARLEAQIQQATRRAAVASRVAQAYEDDRRRIQIVRQTIVREVPHVIDRPVYRDCRLDADGLRLLTAAIAGASPNASGQPPGAMPRPDRPP